MEQHRSEPFFVYYPMTLTHNPFAPTPEMPGLTDRQKMKSDNKHFGPLMIPKARFQGKTMRPRETRRSATRTQTLPAGGLSRTFPRPKNMPLAGGDSAMVIVTSDHGYHFGDKQRVGKGTPWNATTQIPLRVRVPGITSDGSICRQPVSLVDRYPTLIDVCDLPGCPHGDDFPLDGHRWKQQLLIFSGSKLPTE